MKIDLVPGKLYKIILENYWRIDNDSYQLLNTSKNSVLMFLSRIENPSLGNLKFHKITFLYGNLFIYKIQSVAWIDKTLCTLIKKI